MDCAELRGACLRGEGLGPQAEAHAESCPPCAELLADGGALARALTAGEATPPGFESLAEEVAADRGLRAWLASRSSPTRAALLIGATALVAVGAGVGTVRPDLDVYPSGRMALALGLLGGAILPLAWLALRPLHRPPLATGRLVAFTLIGAVLLPLGLAVLPAAHSAHPAATTPEGQFLAKALGCLTYGGLVALPVLVCAGLLDRGSPLRNATLLGLGVAVAALAANLALQLHCPITDRAHLIVSHVAIGAALVLNLGALALTLRGGARVQPAGPA